MRVRIWSTCVLCLAASSAASEASVETPDPSAAVQALIKHEPPADWRAIARNAGGGLDPSVEYRSGADRIGIRIFGGKGSAYASPAAFLRSPAATSMGKKPEPAGKAAVAGKKVSLYTRSFPLMRGDPHSAGAARPKLGRETYLVLPMGKRFAVLSLARETQVPDPDGKGDAAWGSFLRSVRPASR